MAGAEVNRPSRSLRSSPPEGAQPAWDGPARAEMSRGMPDTSLPGRWQVRSVRRELHDIVTLELVPASGQRPMFVPGQFNMLYAFGVGEAAISISAASDDGAAFVHTVREVGAVSRALAAVQPGASLGLRGPFGTGWPVAEAEGGDLLVIAGGLGLAPLRPVVHAVLRRRDRFGRVSVLFGTRQPADILYRDELDRWRNEGRIDVRVTVDHADPQWTGQVGVVPTLVARATFDPARTVAMVCGPEVMMRFTASALLAAGVGADRIHLSMERNMHCAIGQCGHCQFGSSFVCRDGPVMRYDAVERRLAVHEI